MAPFQELKRRLTRSILWQGLHDLFCSMPYKAGRGTYGVPVIYGAASGHKLVIGKYCSIARGVTVFVGNNHNVNGISTYPFYRVDESKGDVIIGNDVWIGTEALIMSGVCVGNGAVIGARSVVTKEVPAYSMVAGNPARIRKFRFNPDDVEKLQRLKWWDWQKTIIEDAKLILTSGTVNKLVEFATINKLC